MNKAKLNAENQRLQAQARQARTALAENLLLRKAVVDLCRVLRRKNRKLAKARNTWRRKIGVSFGYCP